MNTRSLFLIFAVSCLFACNKEYLQWNLDKKKTPPEVTTVAVGEVFASSAFIEIQLDFNGNSEVTQLGVCFGLQNDPDINSNIALAEVSDLTQSVLISGLEPNKVYYARAFAQNIAGVSYGESLSFATLPVSAPTISTSQASNVTLNSVQIGGSVLSDGGSGITEKGICYSSTSNTPTTAHSKVTASGNDASFTVTLSGLENTTTYYARAYATNNLGTSYGNTITFTTASVPDVLVETNNCNSLNGISALFISWQGSSYQSSPMCIANNGFIGSCINDCVSNPAGATIEFQRTFTQVGHIRFRSRAYDGNSIRVPTIYIDNSTIGATDLNAGTPANNWHLIKSDNIASGPHTIRIEWSQVSVYYDYSIDEIEFWE